ncbi:hypothetical protein AURDEDRAFT_170994 [Auricularia subglabra TFB-10046 SS5]|nr:hypothetical protein AURDEDRAFT_170994 [Auricularia subglabra TFB-10046 SS5]
MDALRASFKMLGFKPKHTHSYNAVVAVLLLLSLEFANLPAREEPARVANIQVQLARLLGVAPDDLAQALRSKTSYNLSVILFAFVVELANGKVMPASEEQWQTQIVLLDTPGVQPRSPSGTGSIGGAIPLVSQHGQNGFDEFAINFFDTLIHSYVTGRTFDEASPDPRKWSSTASTCRRSSRWTIAPASSYCVAVEGSGADLVQDLVSAFGTHLSFLSAPLQQQQAADSKTPLFGINRYAGSCAYDVRTIIERDANVLGPAIVALLCASNDPFIAELSSGPGFAAETHSKDPTTVQAQVMSRPLRAPAHVLAPDGSALPAEEAYAELNQSHVYCIHTQLNTAVSELLITLDCTRMQSRYGRRSAACWVIRLWMTEFTERYGRMPTEYGWDDGIEYVTGSANGGVVWTSYALRRWQALHLMDDLTCGGALPGPSEFNRHDDPYEDSKEALRDEGFVMKEVQDTVEEVPTSRARRWWVMLVWFSTWWIPSLVNGLLQHTMDDNFWVAVQAEVYDIMDFWRSDHSDNRALPVNQAMMKELADQDLTNYLPIPFTKSCPDLVTNQLVQLQAHSPRSPTSRIALDLLGVDPKLDSEPLLFRSIGEGSKQLNYGKVYSGLYEFESHVVPYVVIIKVGKLSERSWPGNRGKRDFQILLLHYLNCVHFDLVYLIVTVAMGKAPIPIISLAMLAVVYGLQAVIFILRREFMLVGWLVIYVLAYPIYSFFLPIYSFWCRDDFSWGNTRDVIGEGNNKKVVVADDEKFDESIILLK